MDKMAHIYDCIFYFFFFTSSCTGEAVVKTLQLTDSSHPVGNLGAIADVAVFTVNGVPYIVTASTIAGKY